MTVLFSTNAMLGIIAGLPRPSSFLLDLFFPLIQEEATEEIHFDVKDGTRRLAPFVSPLVAGKLVEAHGFETKTFKPAYIKPKMVIDTNRPLKRVAGEKIGGEIHPGQRVEILTADMLDEQVQMIQRRMEVMASETLRTGMVTVSGDQYPTQVVDFGRESGHTITLEGAERWGQSGVKPLALLDAWSLMVLKRSGTKPTTVVMDVDSWSVFKEDEDVRKRLDTRRVIDARLSMGGPAGTGGTYMGTVDGFDIWAYAEWYIDPEDGEEKPVMPTGTVIMGSPAIEGTRAFGAIRDGDAGYRAIQFFPKSWADQDPSVRYVMTQSAPLTVPTRPNASLCANVL